MALGRWFLSTAHNCRTCRQNLAAPTISRRFSRRQIRINRTSGRLLLRCRQLRLALGTLSLQRLSQATRSAERSKLFEKLEAARSIRGQWRYTPEAPAKDEAIGFHLCFRLLSLPIQCRPRPWLEVADKKLDARPAL